ncbi:MAG: trypsin-like serine protease [Pseudomonadota bacterium]
MSSRVLRLAVAAIALVGASAAADGRRMIAAHEQNEWRAVGRLNLGDAFCTGALVAPDLVATAAHCLFAPRTGVARRADRIHFVAGYRLRRHSGHRRASALTVHPEYSHARRLDAQAVGSDLALVRLAAPFDDVPPFSLAPGLSPGDEVAIVSYGRDRPEAPSIQSPCRATARFGAIAVLACDVTHGVSGAPVFRRVDGEWRIVAVVSSMGDYLGEPHAFAVALDASLGAVLSVP